MNSKETMKFNPYIGYVEVEPIKAESVIADDNKGLLEKAKVISVRGKYVEEDYGISAGDIIFFRPHGFFELPEHDGVKRYVVRLSDEFVLGVIKCGKNQSV